MRIISGSARGRRLKSPKGDKTRPTGDRVREALFNIIGPYIGGGKFLDLFAGTGAVGIEALSRGARHAVFIDREKEAFNLIQENLRLAGLTSFSEVYRQDAFDALEILERRGAKFDLIYVDPPYAGNFYVKVLARLGEGFLLHEGGLVITESDKREDLPGTCGCLEIVRRERYGDTTLSFYKNKNDSTTGSSEVST